MHPLAKKVVETIKEYDLIKSGEKVVVGVSGGPDSLALLHLLSKIKDSMGFELHVAHLNHSFRGKEADAEALWVKKTASGWGLPCTVKKVDVPRLAATKGYSAQEAGHVARKEFYLSVLNAEKGQKIALGHHADDQAETLLLHFLNGAGTEGLRGMLPRNGPFIRPMLFVTRAQIEEYCRDNGLNPRRDPSNEKNIYLRNLIRNELIPWLVKNINPNLVDTLNRTARIFWDEEEYFRSVTEEIYTESLAEEDGLFGLRLEDLLKLPPALQRRVVRYACRRLTGKEGLPFLHVEEIRELAVKKQTGKVLQLPGKLIAEKTYHTLLFYPAGAKRNTFRIAERKIIIPGETYIPETGQRIIAELWDHCPPKNTVNRICLAWEEGPQLTARSRRDGDRLVPPGRTTGIKLKEYLINKKIPRNMRDRLLLVTDGNEVLWLPKMAYSGRLKVSKEEGRYLVLTIKE